MLLSSYNKDKLEAGRDEAGRGCLAEAGCCSSGYFAARIWRRGQRFQTAHRKAAEYLRPIIEKEALAWAVEIGFSNTEIDEVNILNASFLAMNRAVEQLKVKPGIYY